MTAYELADKLESFWLTKNDDLLIKTVTMLRQQADRIAELEKLFNNCNVSDFTPPQKAIIRQGFEKYWGEIWERYTKETTPQIKELSDEEIKPLLDRIQNYLECGGFFNPECMEHDKVRDLIMDCKAILKKASEK